MSGLFVWKRMMCPRVLVCNCKQRIIKAFSRLWMVIRRWVIGTSWSPANVCGEAPWLEWGCDCKLSSLKLKIQQDPHTSLSEAAAGFQAQGMELLCHKLCTWSLQQIVNSVWVQGEKRVQMDLPNLTQREWGVLCRSHWWNAEFSTDGMDIKFS